MNKYKQQWQIQDFKSFWEEMITKIIKFTFLPLESPSAHTISIKRSALSSIRNLRSVLDISLDTDT